MILVSQMYATTKWMILDISVEVVNADTSVFVFSMRLTASFLLNANMYYRYNTYSVKSQDIVEHLFLPHAVILRWDTCSITELIHQLFCGYLHFYGIENNKEDLYLGDLN